MRILDILLNNIGFLVVIAGLLFTFLSKLRTAAGKEAERQGRPMMPPFGGPVWPEPSRQTPGSSAGRDTGERRHEPAPQAVAQQRDGRPDRPQTLPAQAPNVSAANVRAAQAEVSVRSDETMQDAVRGMIWAEILGAPRAKKPYSYRK